MIKIGILTHHAVHNHGAHLQNFALILYLRSLGCDVKTLTYTKNYDFLDDYAVAKYSISIKSIPYYTKYLFKQGLRKTLFNVRKKNLLEMFRNDNSIIGGYYSRTKDLDCIFIGSDEVFSIESGLNPFFWGMGVPCKNVFAYAGSFGPTTTEFIIEKQAEGFIRAGIERFSRISVRDKNSQKIIEKFSGKQVPIVCDPVFLHDFQLGDNLFTKPIAGKYILVYAYDNNMNDKDEVKAIKAYAKSKDLATVSVGFYHRWCDKNINVSPIELLKYIRGAECVVTDTFHGSVGSTIMNRPFAVKIRGNGNKLHFLLDEYGLSSRSLDDFNDLPTIINEDIDYEKVNKTIRRKRENSIDYIKSCLAMVKNDKEH